SLGRAAHFSGDLPLAMQLYEESLHIQRSIDFPWVMSYTIANMVGIAVAQGDLELAARLTNQGLERDLRRGEGDAVVTWQAELGDIALRQGNLTQAQEMLSVSL